MAIVIRSLIEEIDCIVEAEISGNLLVFVFMIGGESVGGAEGERYCGCFSTASASRWVWEVASMAERGAGIAVRLKRGW